MRAAAQAASPPPPPANDGGADSGVEGSPAKSRTDGRANVATVASSAAGVAVMTQTSIIENA